MADKPLLAAHFRADYDGEQCEDHETTHIKYTLPGKFSYIYEDGNWEELDLVARAYILPTGDLPAGLDITKSGKVDGSRYMLCDGITGGGIIIRGGPFLYPRLRELFGRFMIAAYKGEERADKPFGFFKEFAKPMPYRVLAAQLRVVRAKAHYDWCKAQQEQWGEYRKTYSLYANRDVERTEFVEGKPVTTKIPFMHDPDYSYDQWEHESWQEAEREVGDASGALYKAERHLEHVNDMHKSQLERVANDKKRKRADEARWANKRKNRDDRAAVAGKRKRDGIQIVIGGEYENYIGKLTGIDTDDERRVLLKITEGYKEGTIVSIAEDDVDCKEDVDADEISEEQACPSATK